MSINKDKKLVEAPEKEASTNSKTPEAIIEETIEEVVEEVIEKQVEETIEEVVNPTVARQKAAKEAQKEAREKLAKVEAKKQAAEKATKQAAEKAAKVEEKDERPIFEDERGLKFKFKKNTPKTLNIDGKAEFISDLIKDKEVMLELVNGNSNYLEQIL